MGEAKFRGEIRTLCCFVRNFARNSYYVVDVVAAGTLQIRWTADGDKDVAVLGDDIYRRSA